MIPHIIPNGPPEPARYCVVIRVKGLLDQSEWRDWFSSMTLEVRESRMETCISGPVVDQAELYGLLSRLRNLGLTLLSVEYKPLE